LSSPISHFITHEIHRTFFGGAVLVRCAELS
jgi:hypothetical protein